MAYTQPGDKFKPSAGMWNDMLSMLRWFKQNQQSAAAIPHQWARNFSTLPVKNASGSDVARGGILGIDDSLYAPTDNLDGFKNGPTLSCITPAQADHDGKFAVTLEPIEDGAIGRAVLDGLAVCQVSVTAGEEWYEYADVIDADAAKLKLLPAGAAQVLWRETGTGAKWAIVRLGSPPGAIYEDVKFTSALDGGGMALESCGATIWRAAETAYTITAWAPRHMDADQAQIAVDSMGAVRWDRWRRLWIVREAGCAG